MLRAVREPSPITTLSPDPARSARTARSALTRLTARSALASLTGLIALTALAGCEPAARSPSHSASSRSSDSVNINIALPIEELDLPNGLHVVLHRERSASTALVYLRYHVGSKDDPQGRAGFAHLFEHLMFRGSKNTGTKDYKEWFEDIGGDTNAGTGFDHTDYYAEVPPSALPRAIWLEADRMAYPLAPLDEAGFAHERDVVKNELREHYENEPLGNLAAIAYEAVFGANHPYGTTPIGRADELDKTTLAEARAFARSYYRPNNATLVVCGLFDLTATRELVTRYFGTIPPGPRLTSRVMRPVRLAREQRIEVQADVGGPAVAIAWPAPALHEDGSDELAYGLRFFAARVERRLVTEKKIANAVDIGYSRARLGGIATVTVKLKAGASPDTTISVIDEYLNEASRMGTLYPWDTFGNYKTRALVGEVSALEGLQGRAERILHDIEMHGAPNSVTVDLRRLQDVAAADVGAAVDHFLIDPPRVVIVVTPTPGAPPAGRKAPR